MSNAQQSTDFEIARTEMEAICKVVCPECKKGNTYQDNTVHLFDHTCFVHGDVYITTSVIGNEVKADVCLASDIRMDFARRWKLVDGGCPSSKEPR